MNPTRRSLIALVISLALLGAACSSSDPDEATPETTPTETATPAATATATPDATAGPTGTVEPALNQLQSVGSHNSYHLAPQEPFAQAVGLIAPAFLAAIDYSHLPLAKQLGDHGIRHLELDLLADPEGGRYANRNLLSVINQPAESGLPELEEPGFKVLHVPDVDFETTCLTLVICLGEVEAWSSANPDHAPLMILLEPKTQSLADATAQLGVDVSSFDVELVEPPPMTPALFEDLEAEVLGVFDSQRIITPDEVRGGAATLDEAVRSRGWPGLDDSRGKVLFAVTGSESTATYRAGSPALEGKLFFTSSKIGAADGAFVVLDDPIADADSIREALAAGYLVRTRADADTLEARAGDESRRDAAFASGAQFVSTDYYLPDPAFATDYVVVLPGDSPVRCNPVTAGSSCSDPVG